jgi:hypothetical protein
LPIVFLYKVKLALLKLPHGRASREEGIAKKNTLRSPVMKTRPRIFVAVPLMAGLLFFVRVCFGQTDECGDCVTDGYAKVTLGMAEAGKVGAAADNAEARVHLKAALNYYRQALDDFQAAERSDPSKTEPLLLRGVTLNRIGAVIKLYNSKTGNEEPGVRQAFCSALDALNRAKKRGTKNPNLLVELAIALSESNDAIQAKKLAEEFLSLPNTDERLQKIAADIKKKAEEKIKMGKEGAEKIRICGDAPKPFPKPAESKSTEPAPTESTPAKSTPTDSLVQSQFLKWISTGFGYDGNVIQLGRGLTPPVRTPHKDAFLNESKINLEADWFFYHDDGPDGLIDKLAATYLAIHDAYDDISSSNTLAQKAGLSYCRALNTRTCVGLQLNDAWLRGDTKNISNTLVLQPTVSYAESAEQTTQVSYSIIRSDYSITPTSPLAFLDGFSHQVQIQQIWAHALREGEWSPKITITGSYVHLWTGTSGIVGDRQRENPLVKGEWVVFQAGQCCSFVRSVTFSASYEYRHDQYENAAAPDLTAVNRFKRRDDTHLAEIAVIAKLWYDEVLKNRLEATLRYQSTTNESNVPAKRYDRPLFVAAVKVNF